MGVGGFSSICVLKIASQLINRLSIISSFNIIHGDIHPGNFLLGNTIVDKDTIHLIDFGLCNMNNVDDKDNSFRCALKSNNNNNNNTDSNDTMTIDGTLAFSSINVLQGNQCNEKDDLESLAYSLAYLLEGSLPWDRIEEE